MLHQSFPLLLATSYTQAGGPAVRAESFAGGPMVQAPTPFVTGTDDAMSAWFGFLPNVCTDADFSSVARLPVSLRFWRTGVDGGSGLVRPTYRVGIYAPATYTPDVSPNGAGGTYDASAPVISWVSNTKTDSGTWAANTEQDIVLQVQNMAPATFQRGQVMIYVTMPHAASGGAGIQIWGYGFRN